MCFVGNGNGNGSAIGGNSNSNGMQQLNDNSDNNDDDVDDVEGGNQSGKWEGQSAGDLVNPPLPHPA